LEPDNADMDRDNSEEIPLWNESALKWAYGLLELFRMIVRLSNKLERVYENIPIPEERIKELLLDPVRNPHHPVLS
jgi:hypothetical protein